jgi:hypothetical protein
MNKGHWFCDHCDDIIFMSYQKTDEKNVPCPNCGHLACHFVPAKLSREVLPQSWFDKMRDQVDRATTPELPTQNDFGDRPHER